MPSSCMYTLQNPEYACADIVAALVQHPHVHASGATLVQMVCALQRAAHMPSHFR